MQGGVGGAGADQFILGQVSGTVIQADGLDVVRYSEAYDAKALRVVRQGSVADDRVVVSNGGYANFVLDRFSQLDALRVQFSDGTVLTGAQLKPLLVDQLPAPYGTIANDKIVGDSSDGYLLGDLGNDFIDGGTGADRFLFNAGDGQDVIVDTDSTWFNSDLLKLGGATSKQLWLTKSGSNLDIKILGTQDKVTVQNWFAGSSNQVEKITAGDGKSLSASKVQALVNAMASFTPPTDAASLPANTPAALTKLVASSWV